MFDRIPGLDEAVDAHELLERLTHHPECPVQKPEPGPGSRCDSCVGHVELEANTNYILYNVSNLSSTVNIVKHYDYLNNVNIHLAS